ncbi:keratin, type II cytoskeletal 1 [Anabrus simplex]|uniref:keratin, type II cytoskeletal 1 n=1 Tax=Anabrus simplex TaxID=316456 RepID=UPI0034DDAB06
MTHSSQLVVALLATLICSVVTLPVPQQREGENALEAKEALIKNLETDIVKASVAAAAARAVRNEQKFEEDILKAAVETLKADQGNPEKRARDLRALRELVQRDKRQVDLLAGALGGGGEVRAEASADTGSGSSSILQLLPSILGSSSGGGGGDSSDGGGSDSGSILQLLPSILGGLSSGGGDGDSGGSNVLSLLTGVLGASSGGGDSSSGGSGGSGGGSGGFLGSLLSSKLAPSGPTTPPRPGTYDDLIGKGIQGYDPVLAFSNNLGPALRTKFTIFNSLFNLLSGVFSSSGGGKSASLSLTAST